MEIHLDFLGLLQWIITILWLKTADVFSRISRCQHFWNKVSAGLCKVSHAPGRSLLSALASGDRLGVLPNSGLFAHIPQEAKHWEMNAGPCLGQSAAPLLWAAPITRICASAHDGQRVEKYNKRFHHFLWIISVKLGLAIVQFSRSEVENSVSPIIATGLSSCREQS